MLNWKLVFSSWYHAEGRLCKYMRSYLMGIALIVEKILANA
jgi:hypothetical protein